MKVLLISPPVGNIGQAPPSISALAAWLTHLGHECIQWDLGLDAFHYFHSTEYLSAAAAVVEQRCKKDASYSRSSLLEIARSTRRIASQIETAKQILKQPGVESDIEKMVGSLGFIRDAGLLISSAHGLSRLSYSRFDMPGAQADWRSLAEAIRDRGRNIFIDYFREHSLARIALASPHLVAVSVSYHSQLLPAFSLVVLIKEEFPELPVLLGGAFLKAVQDDLTQMPSSVVPADGICIGDGEPTLEAYLRALEERESIWQTPNILLPRGERFVSTGRIEQISLSQAPIPMLKMEGINLGSYLVPRYAIPLPVTRGCHYHRCVYCNISNQAREVYRAREAKRCIDDIESLVRECRTNWFDFPTDSVLPRDLERFARTSIKRGLTIRWSAEVFLDRRLTDEIIALLARSGCCCLRFGLESACPRTLELMDKRIDLKEVSRILKTCHRHGIVTGVMMIIGFPTETQRELLETVEYLQRHASDIDLLTLHPFTVSPGSRLASQPELAGIHLLPRTAVLTPSLPYAHSNPVAMRPEDLSEVVSSLADALSDFYPQSGQLWASGIGGWLTFAACCTNDAAFFKQPMVAMR
ncbi:MAG: B12-binding domain-containing radical SAM protein [Deltaproteobacteria bacterium]|nr:B12-binding domain-containing radical SAM protein [Deltaproteobacteria bacterium]